MDLTFHCVHCKQELAVDASAEGQKIQCPTCSAEVTVPEMDASTVHTANPISASAGAKLEHHFSVPVHDSPAEILLKHVEKAEEEPAPDAPKKIKFRVIRHTDCIEVGHDRYEEMVASFLNKIGEENIIPEPMTLSILGLGGMALLRRRRSF